jgi:hypothetical protein
MLVAVAVVAVLPLLVAWVDGDFAANQARLAAMSPEEREQLFRKLQAFEALPSGEKDRIRLFDQALNERPDAEMLLRTLRSYHDWLMTLQPLEHARVREICDLPAGSRLTELKTLVAQHRQRDLGLTSETRLPPEDFEALDRWVRELVEKKREQLAQWLPAPDRNAGASGRRMLPNQGIPLVMMLLRGDVSNERLSSLVGDEDVRQLAESISEGAAKILFKQPTRQDQVRLIAGWIAASRAPQIPTGELQRIYAELEPARRDEIARLGPVEGRQRLIQLYYREMRFRRRPDRPPGSDPGGRPPPLPRESPEVGPPPADWEPPFQPQRAPDARDG